MPVVMLAVRRAMPRKRVDRFDELVTDGPLRLWAPLPSARERVSAHRLAPIDRESHALLW
jgi:hypothetical protein